MLFRSSMCHLKENGIGLVVPGICGVLGPYVELGLL
jgi:hypothetical protein